MNEGKSVARHASWALTGGFGQALISFIGLVILARLLSPEEFGIAALALMVVRTLNLFCEYLFMETLVQRRNLTSQDIDTAFWTAICVSIFLVLMCFLCSDWIAGIFERTELSVLIRWSSSMLILGAVNGIIIALLRRHMNFRQLTIGNIIGRFFGLVLAIAMAYGNLGAWSLIGQQVGSFAAITVVLWWIMRWRPSLSFSIVSLRQLSPFTVVYLAGEAIKLGSERIFPLLIGYIFGPAVLGLFDLASRISETLGRLVGMATHQITMSIFARQQDARETLRKTIYKATELIAILAIPVFGGLAIVADDVVSSLFGDQWQSAIPLIQLLAIATIIRICSNVINTSLVAIGRPKWRAVKYAAEFVVGSGCLILFEGYGAIATGIAVILRNILTLPIFLYAGKKLIGLRTTALVGAVVKPLVAIILMAITFNYINSVFWLEWPPGLRILSTATAGVILYCSLMWLMVPTLTRKVFTLVCELLPNSQRNKR